jgi:hypothetical protein
MESKSSKSELLGEKWFTQAYHDPTLNVFKTRLVPRISANTTKQVIRINKSKDKELYNILDKLDYQTLIEICHQHGISIYHKEDNLNCSIGTESIIPFLGGSTSCSKQEFVLRPFTTRYGKGAPFFRIK